jgi:hypothetical protein
MVSLIVTVAPRTIYGMGRAPIPGGPQRVSAHVVPKAKPHPGKGDDDERTTVEAPWEDEASTTVDQGQLGIKAQAPEPKHNTNLTHTGTGLDEPTVDDQHAPALSAITIRPDPVARLMITQGNDAGQDIEIRPGKTYTIGRAIDNDVVLTDIAVSRKHFDLKFEHGAWVIVDRGSGNGTIVNGNLEDNPFMLASGDVIEIGNTVFRYEQTSAAPRAAERTYDVDDEEMSTVAGKPVRDDVEVAPARSARPKTLPPPTPLRVATPSTLPPRAASQSAAPPPMRNHSPSPTAPPMRNHSPSPTAPPMRNHSPSSAPVMRYGGRDPSVPRPLAAFAHAQAQPQPASTLPMPQMANRPPLAPTMLGGMPMNGVPTTLPGQPAPQQLPSYPYPQATEIPPHSVHAQMLLIQTHSGRGDGSTAHVPPMPYDAQLPMMPPVHAVTQPMTKRAKLLLAGIALAVLTGIVTAAVVKSSKRTKPSAASTAEATAPKSTPIVEPIREDRPDSKAAKLEAPKAAKPEDPKAAKPEAPKAAKPDARADVPAKTENAVQTEIKPTTKAEPPRAEPRVAAKAEPKQEPKTTARQDPKPAAKKREARTTPTTTAKRVATADSAAARGRADGLYRDRKFSEASSVMLGAAKSAPADEADELRLKGGLYAKLGKSYANGTAPAQKPTDAYEALRSALNYDRNLGGAFVSDLQSRLATVAAKAAVAFLGQKDYVRARNALDDARRYGSTDGNLQLVNQKLEAVAGELYREAEKEMAISPPQAKEKLRRVKSIVDPRSSWAVKAELLLRK